MPQHGLLGQPSTLAQTTILDLLNLERIEENLFRSRVIFEWAYPLYGGQVAAQALHAAGQTVPAGRAPHSLHGYFLRGGRTDTPPVFRVGRARDGGPFSARRVVAIQDGKAIFTMSASFAEPKPGAGQDADPVPEVPAPDALAGVNHPYHVSLETRPADEEDPGWREHTRFWIRCTVALPDDDLVHACVLTYMSDI